MKILSQTYYMITNKGCYLLFLLTTLVFLIVLKIHSIVVYNFKYRTRLLTFKRLISCSTSHAGNVSHHLASFLSLFRLMFTIEMLMFICQCVHRVNNHTFIYADVWIVIVVIIVQLNRDLSLNGCQFHFI